MVFSTLEKKNLKDIVYPIAAAIFIYFIVLGTLFLISPGYFIYFSFLLPIIPILFYIIINKIEFSFLLYIVFLPIIQHFHFLLRSISIGDFVITPDIVIHFILMVALLYHFVFSYESSRVRKFILQDKLILLFVLLSVFSLIAASDLPINHGKRILLYYTGVVQTISFYFALLFFLNRIPNFSKKLLLALALTSFFSALIAFYELKTVGFSIINIFLSRMRIGFGYHNVNLFGQQVALVFPILIYLIKSAEFEKYKPITWFSFFVLSTLAVLTLNRGTFVVIIFNLIFFFWKKENRRMVLALLIIGSIVSIYFSDLLMLYINRFVTNSGNTSSFLADESAMLRIEVWRVGIQSIIQHPFGVGGNGFNYVWGRLSIAPQLYFGTPHQIFLYIGVDYGLPALVIFLVLIVVVFKNISVLSKFQELKEHNIFFYLRISMIGYLIHGFLTGGELSHLSGNLLPNNGYTYILMIVLAIISHNYQILKSQIKNGSNS